MNESLNESQLIFLVKSFKLQMNQNPHYCFLAFGEAVGKY